LWVIIGRLADEAEPVGRKETVERKATRSAKQKVAAQALGMHGSFEKNHEPKNSPKTPD
jgi:hypothetical protein